MSAEFDEYAESYTGGIEDPLKQLIGDSQDTFLQLKVDYLLAYVESVAPASSPSPKVLDFGCGTGGFLKLLQKRQQNATYVGCDVSQGMLNEARNLLTHDVELIKIDPASKLPFPSESFDVVTAVCVFHHIEPADRHYALSEIYRVLKPGGRLFVFEHNPWNPATQWIVKRSPIDANAVLLSSFVATRLLQRTNFLREATRYLLHLPPRSNVLRRTDRWFSYLPSGAQYMVVGRK